MRAIGKTLTVLSLRDFWTLKAKVSFKMTGYNLLDMVTV